MGVFSEIAQAQTQFFSLSDGRRVSYLSLGNPEGTPTFYFHGSPGSRFEALAFQESAQKHNLHIIAPDRPGLGESDYKPDYTLLQYADDVGEMARLLGWERFGIVGLSGGGTTVLSLAFRYPKKLLFAIDIAGWPPIDQHPELQGSMNRLDAFFGSLGAKMPWIFSLTFVPFLWSIRRSSPDQFARIISSSLSDADRIFLEDVDNRKFLHELTKRSVEHGYKGACRDALLRFTDWQFDVRKISFPLHLFQGSDDKFVPLDFFEWKQKNIPNATPHLLQGVGHMGMLKKGDEIFGVLKTK